MNLYLMLFFSRKKKSKRNLDDKNSKRTHWVSFFSTRNTAVYFDSFGIEYIPQSVLN